jgi:hypothetical protein
MVLEPENLNENDAPVANTGSSAAPQSPTEDITDAPEQTEAAEINHLTDETSVYCAMDKQQLVDAVKSLAQADNVLEHKNEAEEIKNQFYKLHRAEIAEKKQAFVESGGNPEDFLIEDADEKMFKDLYKQYREKKSKLIEGIEKGKKDNLDKKLAVISEIEALINTEESLNNTFNEFKTLQDRWKHIGQVPQQEIKNVWESYHLAVGKFYDYVNINKELRDLDLKKNLEQKLLLCEQAERLLLEDSIVKAFGELQRLHESWREIGPTPIENKEEVWERFKIATSTVNKRHQEFFVQLKEQEKRNHEAKKAICEKIKELIDSPKETPKQWTDTSNEVVELQKVWRTVGFAPKKFNNEIYAEFRSLCDEYFNLKKGYFDILKGEEEENKQRKIELCIKAEAMSTSTEWKKTTDEYISLQNEWKTIGNVSKKDSEKLWKRFRTACDKFFEAKNLHFKSQDSEQKENLAKKQAMLEELASIALSGDQEADLKKLMDIQNRWTSIGFVPLKEKNALQTKYREILDEKFGQLKTETDSSKNLKYSVKLESFKLAKNPKEKFSAERAKIQNRIKQLQSDIITLENNIGFFSKSKNASSFIQDVEKKIAKGQIEISDLKEQLKQLNDVE